MPGMIEDFGLPVAAIAVVAVTIDTRLARRGANTRSQPSLASR
ncbi:MAG TPA: hypothetical protein VFO55_15010 [Gemmatimonadaceae bacterium]|nr:hypothetical protein [Gemmatimonadaceae bacterium]